MSTAAQTAANQANAQKSTGPVTPEGKAASSKNNFRHGFRAQFEIAGDEDGEQFKALVFGLRDDHKPESLTENLLVQQMAEHHWLVLRARRFQFDALAQIGTAHGARLMDLFMRYEAQHERGFHKCVTELRKIKEQKAKEQIGFERQKQAEAHQNRKQEATQAKTRLTNAKASAIEIDTEIKTVMQAPIPGMQTFNFDDLKAAFKAGIAQLAELKSAA